MKLVSLTTMSAKSTWKACTVLRIFYPCFRGINENVNPLPPLCNVGSVARALSYLESITYPNCASHMPFKQHCFKGEGVFYFVYSANHRKCSKTFGRHYKLASSPCKAVPLRSFFSIDNADLFHIGCRGHWAKCFFQIIKFFRLHTV